MILADTSVWIDHFRKPDARLQQLVEGGRMCNHPFVTGELVAGSLHLRHRMILMLRALRQLPPIGESEFYEFLDQNRLHGIGLGFVDLHLLAAVSAFPGHTLWSRDIRLRDKAKSLGLAFQPE